MNGNVRILATSRSGWILFLAVPGILLGEALLAAEPLADEPTRVAPAARQLAFSPDGSLLAVACADQLLRGELLVWDVSTWNLRFRHSEPVGFPNLAFSRDGRWLALSRFAPETKIFDARTGELLRELKGHTDQARCAAFTPDNKRIITGSYDGMVRIWDAATGMLEATLEGHKGRIYHVDVSPDGDLLASAGVDARAVPLWDLSSRQRVHTWDGFRFSVHQLAFSADGHRLAIAGGGGVQVFDVADRSLALEFTGRIGSARWVAFSPDQRWLAVATNEKHVHVFAIDTTADEPMRKRIDALLAKFTDDSYEVREQAMAELVAIGMPAEASLQQAIHSPSAETRWRARQLRQRLTSVESAIRLSGHDHEVQCVCFSPNGQLLASGDRAGQIKIWRVPDWTRLASLSVSADGPH